MLTDETKRNVLRQQLEEVEAQDFDVDQRIGANRHLHDMVGDDRKPYFDAELDALKQRKADIHGRYEYVMGQFVQFGGEKPEEPEA